MIYSLLKDKHVSRKVKITIYKILQQQLLLYACECWH